MERQHLRAPLHIVAAAISIAALCAILPVDVMGATDCGSMVIASNGDHRRAFAHEHTVALALMPECEASHVAVESGSWSATSTWRNGKVPTAGAKVLIPANTVVLVDSAMTHLELDWVRVNGTLAFAWDRSTSLKAGTVLVAESGGLEMGTTAFPIAVHAKAELIFAPRRDRIRDPTDLAGGLIAQGVLTIVAAPRTPYAIASNPLAAGVAQLEFAEPVEGWQIGDRLLFAGVTRDSSISHDEAVEIANVSEGGRRIRLTAPLRFDHQLPAEAGKLPVANLTRNAILRSEEAKPLAARGHIIVTRQTGTLLDGALLVDLGRTDAMAVHTLPRLNTDGTLEDGTDTNTIGRYALHFHLRSGASIALPPHLIRRSVVIGSPKHGIVNHGGHVVAEDNVTYNIAGSHYFAENGSEIGPFRRNFAVRSGGSGDDIRSRDAIYDFGHEGHGFWLQSSAVYVTDNWAIGHSAGAFVIFGYPIKEGGKFISFDRKNAPGLEADFGADRLRISSLNFHFTGNKAGASASGIEVWNHKVYVKNLGRSLIEDCVVWDVARHGIFLPYAKNIDIHRVTLLGVPSRIGVAGNRITESITMDHILVSGFRIGIRLPSRGTNRLSDATLANRANLEIATATKAGRVIEIQDVEFRRSVHAWRPRMVDKKPWFKQLASAIGSVVSSSEQTDEKVIDQQVDIQMHDLVVPVNGDVAMLFEMDRITLKRTGEPLQQLFFPSQMPAVVPFEAGGPEVLRGLTAAEIFARYGIAVGGTLAPSDAHPLPRSNVLVTAALAPAAVRPSTPAHNRTLSKHQKYMLRLEAQYPGAFHHFVQEKGPGLPQTWRVTSGAPEAGKNYLAFRDTTPPTFILQPSLRDKTIHPEDIKYGYRVQGKVYDAAGFIVSVRAFTKDFQNLQIEADGRVHLRFDIHDMAGNITPVDLPLRVTDAAQRRGANLSFFMQNRCIQCEYDQMRADARTVFGAKARFTNERS